jgi:uncharacterized protein (TIGR02118 family)
MTAVAMAFAAPPGIDGVRPSGVETLVVNRVVDTAQRIAAPRDPVTLAAIVEATVAAGFDAAAYARRHGGAAFAVEPVAIVDGPAGGTKRMALIRRRPDMTTHAFRAYWRGVHGPIVRGVPGVRRYVQHHVVCGFAEGTTFEGVDGFVELWFDDVATMDAGFAAPAGRDAAADVPNFAASVATFLVDPSPL